MSKAVVHVCTNCQHPDYKSRRRGEAGGEALFVALRKALRDHKLDKEFSVEEITCLGNCKKRCRVSVAAPGNWSWLIGDLLPEDNFDDLMSFLRDWLDADAGLIPKEERSKWLMHHALGRVPPH